MDVFFAIVGIFTRDECGFLWDENNSKGLWTIHNKLKTFEISHCFESFFDYILSLTLVSM